MNYPSGGVVGWTQKCSCCQLFNHLHHPSTASSHSHPALLTRPQTNRMTLNIEVLVAEDRESFGSQQSRVYTPMEVDEPLGETTGWSRPSVSPVDIEMTTPEYNEWNDSDTGGVKANWGKPGTVYCRQKLTDSQMNHSLISNQNLCSQTEWESLDWGPPQNQEINYTKKWDALRHNQPLFDFHFRHIPWPIFRSIEDNVEINTPSVESFIFGQNIEQNRGPPPTPETRKLAKENLRFFHSDKFASILERVVPGDRERAKESAEIVSKILTRHLG
ncbi:hypothetical protein MVEN_00045400 [Mycena venus]|uniref:Uncharacterized protein n=1 Tax=Mycena venus TaxID=2733690 RepID=A0A8H6Z6Q6_9AGAR|nr:hypothetical protein MVEN_00045400 [Mycena venus]